MVGAFRLQGRFEMIHRLRFSTIVVGALIVSSVALAQSERPQAAQGQKTAASKDQKSAPAPRHDISGTWEPANGPSEGIQANGVKAMPNDGKPEHQLPYTPYGLELYKSHHALEGADRKSTRLNSSHPSIS